jgi:hypothetical protein
LQMLFVSLGKMNKAILLSFLLFPFLARAQNDLLILEKHGMQIRTYTIGTDLEMRTVYDQWFQGTITDMHHDTVYVNGLPFSYKEIANVRIRRADFSNTVLSAGMMVAAGGIFVLGAVNGLYRKDAPKDWYTSSGLVTGAALLVGGFLLSKTRSRTYPIGKKFQLQYMVIGADKKSAPSILPISPSSP